MPVVTLRAAILRVGYRMMHYLVMSVAMGKLFDAGNPFVKQQVRQLWEHSRAVAAVSYLLARQFRHLNPEQAMLAGLVHDIGALPIYLYAGRGNIPLDQTQIKGLVRQHSAMIGKSLLQKWNFSEELIKVVTHHDDLQRINNSVLPDYVDVVTMSNLQMSGSAKFIAWENVTAASRLGYGHDACRNFLSEYAEQLAVVQNMLGVDTTKPAQNSLYAVVE